MAVRAARRSRWWALVLTAITTCTATFPAALARKAQARLERLGVEVRTRQAVTAIDEVYAVIGDERIPCRTVIWTAGVTPSPAGTWLQSPTDRAGRVRVQPDCSVPGHPEVFVIGDTASLEQDGKPLPGVAQVAMQQGRFVGNVIATRETGRAAPPPFRYFDKGNMAVVGRGFAILDAGAVKLSGLSAWLVWAFIHIAFLPAPGNRWRVWTQWLWSYCTRQPSSQLIVEPRGGQASGQLPSQSAEEHGKEYETAHP